MDRALPRVAGGHARRARKPEVEGRRHVRRLRCVAQISWLEDTHDDLSGSAEAPQFLNTPQPELHSRAAVVEVSASVYDQLDDFRIDPPRPTVCRDQHAGRMQAGRPESVGRKAISLTPGYTSANATPPVHLQCGLPRQGDLAAKSVRVCFFVAAASKREVQHTPAVLTS